MKTNLQLEEKSLYRNNLLYEDNEKPFLIGLEQFNTKEETILLQQVKMLGVLCQRRISGR